MIGRRKGLEREAINTWGYTLVTPQQDSAHLAPRARAPSSSNRPGDLDPPTVAISSCILLLLLLRRSTARSSSPLSRSGKLLRRISAPPVPTDGAKVALLLVLLIRILFR